MPMRGSPSGVLPAPRDVPWLHEQFLSIAERQLVKLRRTWREVIVSIVLTLCVSFAVGLIYGSQWTRNEYASFTTMTVLALGVLSAVSALKMFGRDRLVFWREASSGVSITAYWLAVTLTHLPLVAFFSLIFTSSYWSMSQPASSFAETWWAFLAVYFACSGCGMLLSVSMTPVSALLSGVVIPLLIGGFLNGWSPSLAGMNPFLLFLCDISYSRHGVDALTLMQLRAQADPTAGEDETNALATRMILATADEKIRTSMGALFAIGCVLRAATLLALHGLNRDKRV